LQKRAGQGVDEVDAGHDVTREVVTVDENGVVQKLHATDWV